MSGPLSFSLCRSPSRSPGASKDGVMKCRRVAAPFMPSAPFVPAQRDGRSKRDGTNEGTGGVEMAGPSRRSPALLGGSYHERQLPAGGGRQLALRVVRCLPLSSVVRSRRGRCAGRRRTSLEGGNRGMPRCGPGRLKRRYGDLRVCIAPQRAIEPSERRVT